MTDKPSIIIARETQGAGRLTALLGDAADVMCFPVFEVEILAKTLPAARRVLVTSRHAIPPPSPAQDGGGDYYVVGKETAETLRNSGAGAVAYCAENVAELVAHVAALPHTHYDYWRGEHVSYDIKATLAAQQIAVDEHVVYRLLTVDETMHALAIFVAAQDGPMVVPLFSRRTARLVAETVFAARQRGAAIYGVALSAAVAEAVEGLSWSGMIVAKKPELSALAKACMNRFDPLALHAS